MNIKDEFTAPLATDDTDVVTLICDDNDAAILADWKYEEVNASNLTRKFADLDTAQNTLNQITFPGAGAHNSILEEKVSVLV